MADTNFIKSVGFQSPGYDYAAELSDIERRRAFAQALQQQSMNPLEAPPTPHGGFAVPISPWQGIAKLAQGAAGGYEQYKATEAQKSLAGKSQEDYQKMIAKGLRELQGSPAQAPITPKDDEGNPMPGVAAQEPNPAAALATFGSHPMGQQLVPLAMQEIQQQKRIKMLAEILRGGQAGAGTPPAGGAPNPTAGMPPQIMALMTSGDPELVKLGETLMAANKGIAQRANAPVVNPFTGAIIAQPPPSVDRGINLTLGGPGGPQAAPISGYPQAQDALGLTPLEKVQNEDQTFSYIPKRQLSSAAAPGQPLQMPPPGSPPMGSVATIPGMRAAVSGLPLNPPGEPALGTSSRNLNAQGQPIQKRGLSQNIPSFGQTQEQQIDQASRTAAGQHTSAEVVKNLQENYARLRDVPQQLANIDSAKSLVAQSGGFMGPAGESLLTTAKFLNDRLGTNINVEGVKGAEELRTRIFMNVMDNLKKMDAQPSQLQQQIMQQALGSLGTDPAALPKMLDAYGGALKTKVDIYHRQVEEAKTIGVNWPHRVNMEIQGRPQSSPAGSPNRIESKSKSGRPIYSEDNGKTWKYH